MNPLTIVLVFDPFLRSSIQLEHFSAIYLLTDSAYIFGSILRMFVKLFFWIDSKAIFGKTFWYIWDPKTAEEMSKLLPIFFWAAILAIWLIALISFLLILSESCCKIPPTIATTTQAELPSPVLEEFPLYRKNLAEFCCY